MHFFVYFVPIFFLLLSLFLFVVVFVYSNTLNCNILRYTSHSIVYRSCFPVATTMSLFSLSICCYLLFCCPFARFNVLFFFSVSYSSRPHSRFSGFCLIFFPAISIGIVLDFFVFLYFSLSLVLSLSHTFFFLLSTVSLSCHRLLDVCVNQQLQ